MVFWHVKFDRFICVFEFLAYRVSQKSVPQIPKKIAIHARVLNFLMYFSSVFSKILTAVLFARKFYSLMCLEHSHQ